MNRKIQLILVLAVAATLRFTGLDWDQGHAFHPDERRIAFALEEISVRPLQLNPHFFSYGSFPLYLQKAWTSAAGWLHPEWRDFSGHLLAGRTLSALIGVATVGWLFVLGRRLYDPGTAVLAALLLALSVLPIQHAHFVTVDLYQSALVVFTLERLIAFAGGGGRRTLVTAAAVIGLALATKVSSAPLLVPLALTPWISAREPEICRSFSWRVGSTTLALAVSGAFFLLGEPYALLDRAAFLHDVREQAAMVRQAGTVPYTIQYLGTLPYLDDLRQAFTWGMGPALGLAALAGTAAAIFRVLRHRRWAEIAVLAFFLPYFLLTGSFPVKFMRYLLPLYPLWCLYAARLITGGKDASQSVLRKLAALVVILATAGYALAFTSITLRPHVWVTASRWFYGEIPAGSTVLTPHWDEGFPVSVNGFEPSRYRHRDLPLYEADNERKIALLAERLAEGDVLVFPSKRLYGAISNAPSRYPKTSRFLELLFAGDLGYRLEQAFASRPILLGFELDDDFADESFTVYDHPKTLIFRKTESLAAAVIAERIRTRVPSKRIGRAEMLGASAGQAATPDEAPAYVESSWGGAGLWVAALALLVFSGGRLLARAVPRLPAIAVGGLGPAFGYLLFTYLTWLAVSLGMVPFEPMAVAVIAATLAIFAWRLPAARGSSGTLVFFASFLFFLAIRAGNPEIYWGEKPMDFSFLNAIYRSSHLPPPEPWMSGKIINYPYLGHFGVAAVGKLARVAPALAFNLGIATSGALTAAAAFGVGALLTGSRGGGFVAMLLVAFAGNLAGPFEYAARGTIDFHYFWATSRVIRDTINEFPLWSFLFADLHAHVMATPLSLLFLGLAAAWFRDRAVFSPALLASLSLVLAAIATTSTWSLPVYAGALAGLALVAAVSTRRPAPLAGAIVAIVLSYAWFLPYWRRFTPPSRNWGPETQAAPLSGVLLIFGGFLLVMLVALAAWSRERAIRTGIRLLFLAALAIAAAHSTRAAFSLLAAVTAIAAFTGKSPEDKFVFSLAAGASALGALADTIFLWDRMNTIFKLYLEMWITLGVAAAFWLWQLFARAEAPGSAASWRHRAAIAGITALGLVSAFTSVTDVAAILRTRRVPGPRPTLNGTAYIGAHHPGEAMAIHWLNRNIAGTPVLLEAQGPSYQEFSRISMNTGLPTVLGWEYHLSQRAHAWVEIDRRKADVETIFTTMDRAEIEQLIDRYRVAIVYVGPLERHEYGAGALSKFDEMTDLFQPIYRNSSARIYAVTRNFRWSGIAVETEDARPEAARKIPDTLPAPPVGRLRQPRGVAIDASGNVWVADFGNNRIQVFDASLRSLRAFGRRGEEPGEFRDPCGVAIGPDGLVYVADTWNQRVQVLDTEGRPLREWTGGFYGPRGIAIGADGSVYVADTGNGQIAKFSAAGAPIARWGKKGSGAGELQEPTGIAIAPDGRIFVADAGNQRIVVLSQEGAQIATLSVPGWKRQVFVEPYLAVLPDGRLVASDPSGDRLLFFTPDGHPTGEILLGPETNPTGVVVGSEGRILVSELKADLVVAVSPP